VTLKRWMNFNQYVKNFTQNQVNFNRQREDFCRKDSGRWRLLTCSAALPRDCVEQRAEAFAAGALAAVGCRDPGQPGPDSCAEVRCCSVEVAAGPSWEEPRRGAVRSEPNINKKKPDMFEFLTMFQERENTLLWKMCLSSRLAVIIRKFVAKYSRDEKLCRNRISRLFVFWNLIW